MRAEPAPRTQPRLLEVIRTGKVSPNLQRITLGGTALHGFPGHRKGAHIKIFLPRAHQTQPQLPQLTQHGILWPEANERPITRTYSVRDYRVEHNELDVDFVLHGEHSPASNWAMNAKVGDFLGVAGPGGPDPLLTPADWHILAGDMTALPAISALLEELPASAKGFVFIETDHVEDQHVLINHTQMVVCWVVRDMHSEMLLEEIKRVAPTLGTTSISAFIAGENSAVVGIRDYLREVYGLKKSHLYAVPYWRRGQDEETYHKQRHEIMDQVY
jgi:NADPH-dependent ferric siderophore reductase